MSVRGPTSELRLAPPTQPPSRLERVLSVGLAQLSLTVGCPSEPSSKRPRRSARHTPSEEADGDKEQPVPNNLPATATDAQGRLVYADLQAVAQQGSQPFETLLARLVATQPTERALARLTPINRGRILVEIEDEATLSAFAAWLRAAAATEEDPASMALRRILEPLGPRLRLLGAQWIVPRVTEDYRPRRVPPQKPHSDVGEKGHVISIAINVKGRAMGTLVDPCARIAEDGVSVIEGCGFGRANTPVFVYDTGAVHAGPPGAGVVQGPFPRFFVERVFFLLSSDALDPDLIAPATVPSTPTTACAGGQTW